MCERSVYYPDGIKAWKVTGKYVTKAKRRGLTCGVTEVVVQPKTAEIIAELDASERKQVQRSLAELGFYSGKFDGVKTKICKSMLSFKGQCKIPWINEF